MIALFVLSLIAATTADLCRCVFNSGVEASQMQGVLDYVCANMDCNPIQPGGEAFYPDLLRDHAAWAADAWFQVRRVFRCSYFKKTKENEEASFSLSCV